MSLDKAIKYGKEKRKSYFGSKSLESTCRNHGSCPFCTGNRLYQFKREEEKAKNKIKEFYKDY